MRPGTLIWFAWHESRLAWREWMSMLQGSKRGRGWLAAVAIVIFTIVMHLITYEVLEPAASALRHPDKALFVAMMGPAFLAWTLLLSQAMESVTRGFYARASVELVLSSPASAARLFAIRIIAIAVAMAGMAILLVGPVINVLAMLGGSRYLFAYGVLAALALSAVAVAAAATALLFRMAGPKRTRLIAQVMAAITGAGFVVGVQAAAILSYGTMSRTIMFQSPEWIAAAPGLSSPFWWPSRAATGDALALAAVLGIAGLFFAASATWTARAFAQDAITVADLVSSTAASGGVARAFSSRSQSQSLRWKEWTLLRRDPWLVSQSLMQVLYLLPPALMLWHNFGAGSGSVTVLVPVLVMAAGQLAGGLAWLAISGEDAPDLVATAPVQGRAILRAKITAVLGAVALPVVPVIAGMALVAPYVALAALLGAAVASAGAGAVQMFFKAQAKRTQFRRRQTSSRLATFAEAFWSISVAAAAGLAAAGYWAAIVPGFIAIAVLLASRAIAGPAR